MQKIMFNDRFELTQAVLEGRKTQTRRFVKYPIEVRGKRVGYYHYDRISCRVELMDDDEFSFCPESYVMPMYKVGEVVAVAQRYSEIGAGSFDVWERESDWFKKGFSNKMFVKSELMPHQIRITKVRLQRLQEITDDECLLEGIQRASIGFYVYGLKVRNHEREAHRETENGCMKLFPTAREAYSKLIDTLSGKGTWEGNPYVFVYDFELVK